MVVSLNSRLESNKEEEKEKEEDEDTPPGPPPRRSAPARQEGVSGVCVCWRESERERAEVEGCCER